MLVRMAGLPLRGQESQGLSDGFGGGRVGETPQACEGAGGVAEATYLPWEGV